MLQTSRMTNSELPTGVVIAGNKKYHCVTTETYKTLIHGLSRAQTLLEAVSYKHGNYKTYTDVIYDLFPHCYKKKYSTKEICEWKKLALMVNQEPTECVAQGLSLMTSENYDYRLITGKKNCEWQVIYYPSRLPENAIQQIVADYIFSE